MGYKKPCKEMYHIFTDNNDEYVETLIKALDVLADYIKDDYDNIRIYHQTEWNKDDGIFEDGDCIFSIGSYPM